MLTQNAGKTEKLFYIERGQAAYDEVAGIPEEYLPFIMPYAGVYFESDHECEMISQHRKVGPFSIWVQEVLAREDLILCPYTPQPIWALHFMYETSVDVELYKGNNFALDERECNLFNLEPVIHRVPMTKGQRLLSCHINILPQDLRKLASKYPGLRCLAEKKSAGITAPLNTHPYHTNSVCSYLLQNMLLCRHIEAPADFFLYRICVDLFLNFARQDQQVPMRFLDLMHNDELNMLFRVITEAPHQNFCLGQLCELAALSPKVLEDGFDRNYSVSVGDFTLMVKMIMVFDLLTKKDTPLTAIAHAAGYKNRHSLNRAFKKYYGCELEELRRAM